MTTLFQAKHALARFFNALGLEVRRYHPPKPERASLAGGLGQLARLGIRPRTVIDVGVASATSELYASFPDAALLLIEPMTEFEPFLRQICASRKNAQYVLAAAGEASGTAVLHIHPDKVGSSLLREVEGPSVDGVPRSVPVVTVDQVCLERKLTGPYLLKVDVQGAELQVLRGATGTLREAEAVVLEVSLLGAMIHGPELFDVVSAMHDSGFVAYDLLGFDYRPLDNALSQIDVIFVSERSSLRQSRGYATAEQRQARDREHNEKLSELLRQPS